MLCTIVLPANVLKHCEISPEAEHSYCRTVSACVIVSRFSVVDIYSRFLISQKPHVASKLHNFRNTLKQNTVEGKLGSLGTYIEPIDVMFVLQLIMSTQGGLSKLENKFH